MGNRAVITTLQNYNHNGVGVYLHWNGGRDSVEGFLEYMKLKQFRSPDKDCYGWARLCQVIGNFFGGTLSIGIDTVNHLDTNNGDNGVYIIRGWDIISRKDFDGIEQNQYKLDEMLETIDACQPEDEQLGKEFLAAKQTQTSKIRVGDEVFIIDLDGKPVKYTVVGYGDDTYVNGSHVEDVPYIDRYENKGRYDWNINNYLLDKSYRVAKTGSGIPE